ncbi:MAG: hypothetical protein MZU97_01175 [Bacillus subtilis]|nr:hypothetical protein [Bacillus subtilis]
MNDVVFTCGLTQDRRRTSRSITAFATRSRRHVPTVHLLTSSRTWRSAVLSEKDCSIATIVFVLISLIVAGLQTDKSRRTSEDRPRHRGRRSLRRTVRDVHEAETGIAIKATYGERHREDRSTPSTNPTS